MYYGFDYDAAIRWFERAAEGDAGSALPHWGIALALGPNLNDRPMEGRMPKASASLTRGARPGTATTLFAYAILWTRSQRATRRRRSSILTR